MKRNFTILTLSSLAIVIVVVIEIFLVLRIYRLETEKFDYRYREILQNGLNLMDKGGRNAGLARTYLYLDKQAGAALDFFRKDSSNPAKLKEIILATFHKTVVQKQDVDSLLTIYLKKLRVETGFSSAFSITDLVLFDNDKVVRVFNQAADTALLYPDTLHIHEKQVPVNHYDHYGDFLGIGIDYYVDFNNKKAVVLREIAGSLAFVFIALAVVCLIFLLSMRNLMEERRLSQLKTDFINNMTHELKTPLSTISVATRTLENDSILDDRDKTRETVSVIRRQNRQLTKQINHLLEISMWERKQFSLNRQMLDLEPFLSGIAESFRWECKDRVVTLEEKFSISIKEALLDEAQVTVALHNLLVNSVKYNNQEPVILFEAHTTDRLHISISDNGIGISKEDQKHIFDKFYRVSTGNVHKVKGLGLGLFYVKQIIEAHGGTIEVNSKPGKGSTFTIILPVNGKNQNPAG